MTCEKNDFQLWKSLAIPTDFLKEKNTRIPELEENYKATENIQIRLVCTKNKQTE